MLESVIPVQQKSTEKKEAEFLLHRSAIDKLHWCIEINTEGSTVKIADITYLILFKDKGEWVVR